MFVNKNKKMKAVKERGVVLKEEKIGRPVLEERGNQVVIKKERKERNREMMEYIYMIDERLKMIERVMNRIDNKIFKIEKG